ncbi:glycoside hydrolase family 28 protein [Paxillus rubicundulus Ve08.2h10]|uniref:endo-polygalacturonase n=1 Tax=Paxillus rubicundulus Ve08.2h10 TaxID=930991 RepID=A0A0D0EBL5_9AGAM|nr:glycoside hydrolase family 28 protein [Paxillus rubicundulus Ve08.2h10]
MSPMFAFASLFIFLTAAPQATSSSNCTGTISSLSDVSTAVQCTTVNINAFTVPAGQTFNLDLLHGTTVNVLGEIQFGLVDWAGPLFRLKGTNIKFNGNGKTWDGGGPFYWDGQGTNNGVTKPHPMMKITISGTLSDVYVVNSPAQAISVTSLGSLNIAGVTVNNSQGNFPNARSHGLPAGHNTDGFDLNGDNLVVRQSTVINQDDCIAICRGSHIVLEDNYCDGGHGISIGGIVSNVVVDDVLIQRNTVVNSMQAFRIKTQKAATNSTVSNVVFSNNTGTDCTDYGFLITQSYPTTIGTPGKGVIISDISFHPGTTTLTSVSDGHTVAVNCGEGSCTGTWDWSGLKTSGGKVGLMNNVADITGYP